MGMVGDEEGGATDRFFEVGGAILAELCEYCAFFRPAFIPFLMSRNSINANTTNSIITIR